MPTGMNPYEFYGPDEARRRGRRYSTITRAWRKANGWCIDCGEKRKRFKRRDRIRCAHCLAINAAAVMRRHQRARNIAWLAGNCVECGAHPARDGRKDCESCYEVGRLKAAKRDQRIKFTRKRRSDLGSRRPMAKTTA